jgi:hypothetical protein
MAKGRVEERDEILGAALRELEAPEHRPEFHGELRRRLAEERAARVERRRPSAWAASNRVRWTLRVAAIGAGAAVVVLAIGLPRTGPGPRPGGVEPATAALVKKKLAAALTATRNLSGRVAYFSRNPLTGEKENLRWSFVLTERGDFRLTDAGRRSDVAYDASEGVERSINASASIGEGRFYAERTGLAPGSPDPGPSDWILERDLGSVVRALLAAEDPPVVETEYRGRAAWRLSVPVPTNLIYPDADHFDVTVDQETGIPVRVVATLDGEYKRELRVEDLVVDRALARDQFDIEFPPRAEVLRTDEGFRRVELSRASDIVGYDPLVPENVPDGYELAEVAVATSAGPTGAEGANPPSRNVVSLSYRRGFAEFVVTTRLRGPDPSRWTDPLATGEGFRDEPERVTLGAGALAGVEADLLIAPRNVPHVWAMTDELVVTVAGDLTREELLEVAESLD